MRTCWLECHNSNMKMQQTTSTMDPRQVRYGARKVQKEYQIRFIVYVLCFQQNVIMVTNLVVEEAHENMLT